MSKSVTYTAVWGIPLVQPGDDICSIIIDALRTNGHEVRSNDIIVIAQKIISKAENRYVNLAEVVPSEEARRLAGEVGKDPRIVQVILQESSEVVRYRENVIVVAHRLGFVMANAGVDQSNIGHNDAADTVLLLPSDPDGTCEEIKRRLDEEFSASVGVIINDSFGRPWRNGVVGVALGSAGIPALRNMIGLPDLFGRPLRVTEIAVADELASAASILMGQGGEGLPVIHVRGVEFDAAANPAATLIRSKRLDMFR
jgi:coenzyme F420-0:L-glutamate ligase/coenzyme F420-1:gamma-L-glutamate ligase